MCRLPEQVRFTNLFDILSGVFELNMTFKLFIKSVNAIIMVTKPVSLCAIVLNKRIVFRLHVPVILELEVLCFINFLFLVKSLKIYNKSRMLIKHVLVMNEISLVLLFCCQIYLNWIETSCYMAASMGSDYFTLNRTTTSIVWCSILTIFCRLYHMTWHCY